MIFTPTELSDVIMVFPEVFSDSRGENWEVHHQGKFSEHGIPYEFIQDNQSNSRRTVLRGLHYQIKKPQGKLVRAIKAGFLTLQSTSGAVRPPSANGSE